MPAGGLRAAHVRPLHLYPVAGTGLLQLRQCCLGVIQDALKLLEGRVHGGRGGKVNTGVAQLVQRVGASAHGQELLVALDGGLALFQDALGQGDSGGVAGGILVT